MSFWIALMALVFAGWCCFSAGRSIGRAEAMVERILTDGVRDAAVLETADVAHLEFDHPDEMWPR